MSAQLDPAIRRDLARAALSLAGVKPWREVTLATLAHAAARPISDFYGASLGEAVDCVEEAFDRAIADNMDQLDPGQSVRDRLFELIMRRFEAMEPHRAAVLAMEHGVDRDPTLMAAAHQRHVRCARWVLALAGLEADGMTGQARAQGLGRHHRPGARRLARRRRRRFRQDHGLARQEPAPRGGNVRTMGGV